MWVSMMKRKLAESYAVSPHYVIRSSRLLCELESNFLCLMLGSAPLNAMHMQVMSTHNMGKDAWNHHPDYTLVNTEAAAHGGMMPKQSFAHWELIHCRLNHFSLNTRLLWRTIETKSCWRQRKFNAISGSVPMSCDKGWSFHVHDGEHNSEKIIFWPRKHISLETRGIYGWHVWHFSRMFRFAWMSFFSIIEDGMMSWRRFHGDINNHNEPKKNLKIDFQIMIIEWKHYLHFDVNRSLRIVRFFIASQCRKSINTARSFSTGKRFVSGKCAITRWSEQVRINVQQPHVNVLDWRERRTKNIVAKKVFRLIYDPVVARMCLWNRNKKSMNDPLLVDDRRRTFKQIRHRDWSDPSCGAAFDDRRFVARKRVLEYRFLSRFRHLSFGFS